MESVIRTYSSERLFKEHDTFRVEFVETHCACLDGKMGHL